MVLRGTPLENHVWFHTEPFKPGFSKEPLKSSQSFSLTICRGVASPGRRGVSGAAWRLRLPSEALLCVSAEPLGAGTAQCQDSGGP
ncbi:hypothetical protein EYF80_060020 [Liparis tanakae]|uniref:Uncharacterized protein n=1 Tax=Liparis tanakae TaxID=230148 RepID=A0A4Z2EN66_9TELE|nr:hypothetical protein EYF80_060020 [Liparis tanakae]